MLNRMQLQAYDRKFFDWQEDGSIRSAQVIVPLVARNVELRSVIDIGCGTGGWLGVWRQRGVRDIAGVDGAHNNKEQLHIPAGAYCRRDLTQAWSPRRRYDLAQSLEVAEHLPADSGPRFVALLCSLADIVLFSAAQPGQGGEFHLNERPLAYWQRSFGRLGFQTFDAVRPLIADDGRVEG